jgi:hypothetical protein
MEPAGGAVLALPAADHRVHRNPPGADHAGELVAEHDGGCPEQTAVAGGVDIASTDPGHGDIDHDLGPGRYRLVGIDDLDHSDLAE